MKSSRNLHAGGLKSSRNLASALFFPQVENPLGIDPLIQSNICVTDTLECDNIIGKNSDNDTFVNNVLIGNNSKSVFPSSTDKTHCIIASNTTNASDPSSIALYNSDETAPNITLNSFDVGNSSIIFNGYCDNSLDDLSSSAATRSWRLDTDGNDKFRILSDRKAQTTLLDYDENMSIDGANRILNIQQIVSFQKTADAIFTLGNVANPVNTQDCKMFMQAKRDVLSIIAADTDGLSSNDELFFIFMRHANEVDCRIAIPASDEFLFQTSNDVGHSKSDIVFSVGGVYNKTASYTVPQSTSGHTEAMRIIGSNANVQIPVNLQVDSISELTLSAGLDIELMHVQDALPTASGIEMIPQLVNPFQTTSSNTFWLDNGNSNRPNLGNQIILRSTAANLIDNRVCRYDQTNGIIQSSSMIIDDSGNISGVNNFTFDGTLFVNTILEKTLDNGVDVESVHLENNLIIANGLEFNPVAANPGTAGLTLWSDTNNSNRLQYGARTVILMDNPTADNRLVKTDTTLGRIQETSIVIDDSNNLTSVNSITFNSGGTALNHYEEATNANSVSGIWASSQNLTLTFTRVGDKVTMIIPTILAAANTASFITLDSAYPANFRPSSSLYLPILILDDGTYNWSTLLLGSGGTFNIYSTAGLGNFSGTSGSTNSGFFRTAISWIV